MAGGGRSIALLLVFAAFAACLVPQASAVGIGANLVVFGDSLSDTGNTFKLFNGTFPEKGVYFTGRFTNAPGTWVDQLKAKKTQDYAYGGATACTWSGITGRQANIPTMEQEVDKYIKSAKFVNGTRIVVIWGGHNDYLSITQIPFFQRFTIPKRVRGCLTGMAEAILKADPKCKVVVGSVMALKKASFDFTLKLVPALVRQWNKYISDDIAQLNVQYKGRVSYWDVNSVLEPILNTPSKFGVKATSGSCVRFKLAFDGFFRDLEFDLQLDCKSPNDFFFYDPIHPTARVHGLLAANLKLHLKKVKYI